MFENLYSVKNFIIISMYISTLKQYIYCKENKGPQNQIKNYIVVLL